MQLMAAASWLFLCTAPFAAAGGESLHLMDTMKPLVGQWSCQQDAEAWTTQGESPSSGWYLRSERHYQLQRLSFRVRRAEQDGLIFLHTRNWQVVFAKDRVTASYAPEWYRYWFTATRAITFAAGDWHRVELVLDGKQLAVVFDGRDVLHWHSPAEEWGERVRQSGKLAEPLPQYPAALPPEALAGNDEFVVLHPWQTHASFAELSLEGKDLGMCRDFKDPHEATEGLYVRPDTAVERLAPTEPVAVSWKISAPLRAKATSLPAVEEWRIEPQQKYGDIISEKRDPVDFFVGTSAPGDFPATLQALRGWPQSGRIFFNLKTAGIYTLQVGWNESGLGWGPNVLEALVDGEVVSREVYRAGSQFGGTCPVRDYTPLRLEAGPHVVELRSGKDHIKRVDIRMKYMHLPLGRVALVKGAHEPVFEFEAGRPATRSQKAEALADGPEVGEQYGKIVKYRITKIPTIGEHKVTMGFREVDVARPGQRLMTISINGKVVADNFDVLATAGSRFKYLEHTCAATPVDGVIEVRLEGRNFKAFINRLHISDPQGKTVFAENCGWTPSTQKKSAAKCYEPEFREPLQAHTPSELFDGHNLIANPHFTLTNEAQGLPREWFAATESPDNNLLRPLGLDGTGTCTYDANEGHAHRGAARISTTGRGFALTPNWVIVDYGKTQRFSFWAKTSGADGRVFAEIVWFALDADTPLRNPASSGYFRPLGRNPSSTILSGDRDWTELAVETKPPFGAVFAALLVHVENNTRGTVWVDDATFDGYGCEPLEIQRSFLGFHPQGSKRMVIRALQPGPVHWELQGAAPGRTVAAGEAVAAGYEEFSRRYHYRVDLGGCTQPGEYVLVVRQGNREARTATFRISDTIYRDLSQMLLNGLTTKRFNAAVEGGHDPEALEDGHAIATSEDPRFAVFEPVLQNERCDISGGWYDAGDMIKHTEFWPAALLACRQMLRFVGPELSARGHSARDELLWGLRAFHRFQKPSGSFYVSTKPQANELDNIPFYGTDRAVLGELPLPQASGIAAMLSYELATSEAQLSKTYLETAKSNYDWNWQCSARYLRDAEPRVRFLYASKFMLAELYLARLTDDPLYSERLDTHAQEVAAGLRAGLWRGAGEMTRGNLFCGGIVQDFVLAPCELLHLQPEHPRAAELRSGLRSFAEAIAELSKETPWDQALAGGQKPGDPAGRWPGSQRPIGYWAGLAHSLAQISLALHSPEIAHLAERQLQWCLGNNLAGMSAIHGVGDRVMAGGDKLFQHRGFFESWLKSDRKLMNYDGMVPTLCFRDVGDGTLEKKGKLWPARWGYPGGYCGLYLQPDYAARAGSSEYYLPLTANMAMAASAVHAALKSLD